MKPNPVLKGHSSSGDAVLGGSAPGGEAMSAFPAGSDFHLKTLRARGGNERPTSTQVPRLVGPPAPHPVPRDLQELPPRAEWQRGSGPGVPTDAR